MKKVRNIIWSKIRYKIGTTDVILMNSLILINTASNISTSCKLTLVK